MDLLSLEFEAKVRAQVEVKRSEGAAHPIVAACNEMEYDYLLRYALASLNERDIARTIIRAFYAEQKRLYRELWSRQESQILPADPLTIDTLQKSLGEMYGNYVLAARTLPDTIQAMSQAQEEVLEDISQEVSGCSVTYVFLDVVYREKERLITKKG